MPINVTISGETAEDALRELKVFAAGIAGADPQPVATKARGATSKQAEKATDSSTVHSAPSTASSAPVSATSAAATAAPAQSAEASAPSATDAPAAAVTKEELTAAANAASAKIGPGGPGKIQAWIKANFQKADGTEGTLMLTKAEQQPALIAGLGKIARGELTL